MLTHGAWRTLTPIFDTGLSRGHLIAQGEVFAIVNYLVTPTQLDPPHWHDTYEIGYVRKGTGIIVMGQREYPYIAGQVYVINDLEPHRCYSGDEETHLFGVHFHPSLLESGRIGQMHREVRAPFLPNYGQDGPLIPLDNPLTVPNTFPFRGSARGSNGKKVALGCNRQWTSSPGRWAACTAGDPGH